MLSGEGSGGAKPPSGISITRALPPRLAPKFDMILQNIRFGIEPGKKKLPTDEERPM